MPQSRRLTAIMFADIAGYTAMMQRNESEGLEKVHRFSEVMEANASANNGEILEFRGDGCLAVFNSAVEAMHAAKAIQESLKEEPQVPLRIGIHIGDIVFTDGNIYGDGVNLASRVESMGVPGSILVTERVIHDVKSHPEFELTSLGKFQFKNVEKPMEVFALANEGFVVPQKGEIIGKFQNNTPLKLFPVLGILLLALLSFSVVWVLQLKDSAKSSPEIEYPSVAVLPFFNLNKDTDGELFCDGMTEDILTYLSKVKDIKVISRSSAMQFKNSEKSIPEIAEELDVAHIVEGRVRFHENKVRINVSLVQVNEDKQLWAEIYDRDLKDIFDVQSEVSQQVVKALELTISPKEQERLSITSHTSPEAYQLYLKGKRALENRQGLIGLDESKRLLQDAIELDSNYTDAYAYLAYANFLGAFVDGKWQEDILNRADKYVEKALDLDKENIFALNTLGAISHIRGNLEKKFEMVQKTLELAPNNPNIHHSSAFYYSFIDDRENEYFHRKKAFRLDPLVYEYHFYYIRSLIKLRRLKEAKEQLALSKKLFPNNQNSLLSLDGFILVMEKEYQAAIPYLKKENVFSEWAIPPLGFAYAKTNQRTLALAEVSRLRSEAKISTYHDKAVVFAGLSQTDSLYKYMDLAINTFLEHAARIGGNDQSKAFVKKSYLDDIYFEAFRNEVRFQQILDKL